VSRGTIFVKYEKRNIPGTHINYKPVEKHIFFMSNLYRSLIRKSKVNIKYNFFDITVTCEAFRMLFSTFSTEYSKHILYLFEHIYSGTIITRILYRYPSVKTRCVQFKRFSYAPPTLGTTRFFFFF